MYFQITHLFDQQGHPSFPVTICLIEPHVYKSNRYVKHTDYEQKGECEQYICNENNIDNLGKVIKANCKIVQFQDFYDSKTSIFQQLDKSAGSNSHQFSLPCNQQGQPVFTYEKVLTDYIMWDMPKTPA